MKSAHDRRDFVLDVLDQLGLVRHHVLNVQAWPKRMNEWERVDERNDCREISIDRPEGIHFLTTHYF